MIEENGDAEFHFWGPAEAALDEPAEFKATSNAFVDFLKSAPNVHLRGRVTPGQLAIEMQEMDCFILAYVRGALDYDLSNSHKILEYLSTGKTVVSSQIASYAGRDGLLEMPKDDDDSRLPDILRDTLSRLDALNSPDRQRRRREFALDNTYARQIDRIRAFLETVGH